MKKSFYLFLILFSLQAVKVYSQNNFLTKEEIDQQYKETDLLYPDSDEDLKRIETLIESSKRVNYKNGIITGKIKILFILKERSEYKKMLELISEIEALGLEDNLNIVRLYFYKGFANKELGIEKEALRNLQDALKYAKLVEDNDSRHGSTSNIYNALGYYYESKSPDSLAYYQEKELRELEQISDKNPLKYRSIALNKINRGKFYLSVHNPQRLDLAEPYFTEVYNYKTTHPDVFEDMDLPILCGVGEFYLAKGDYKKSIELFNEVLQREKHKKNPTYRSYAYSALADTYEELEVPQEQAKYTKLYAILNDSINKAAKQEVNQQFNKLVTNVKKKEEKEYTSDLKVIFIIGGSLILVMGLSVWLYWRRYWRRKSKLIHQKYEALIAKINAEKIEIQHKEEYPEDAEESAIKSTVRMTDETEKTLLRRLEKFEKSQLYLSQDINRPWLVDYINTNSKYLSEILRVHRNKTYNNYINGLRINYLLHKLISEPVYREYKIEYLAEECGYSSRQVFLVCFKKETGFSPSYFIENLKKEVNVN